MIPVEDFTQADRERVLELLLSQERVVSLIYAKTFPINAKHGTSTSNHAGTIDGGNGTNNNGSNTNNAGGSNNGNTSPSNFDLSHLLSSNNLDFDENAGNTNGGNNRPVTANNNSVKLPHIAGNTTSTRTTSR